MIKLRKLALLTGALAMAQPVAGADFSDPTWPCVQRKVETLSLGLMWPFPVESDLSGAVEARAADIRDLADTLSLRRIELETIRPKVESFAAKYDGDPDTLGLVFERVFESLSKRRGRIIRGIGDFSLGQIALAEQIDAKRAEMDTALAAADPDFDRIDKIEEELDWDQIIYTDRQRSITYLCETPQLLEKRLFAIAQMLQQVADDKG